MDPSAQNGSTKDDPEQPLLDDPMTSQPPRVTGGLNPVGGGGTATPTPVTTPTGTTTTTVPRGPVSALCNSVCAFFRQGCLDGR